MWGKMFGTSSSSKAKAKPGKSSAEELNESIQRVRTAIEQLDKREALVEKRIAECVAKAKERTKAGDKKSAIFQLKKKKQLEKQMEGIQAKKLNLETQIMSMEEAHMNAETMKAMTTGAKAIKRAVAEADLDKTEDMMEEITEAMEGVAEMSDAMAVPLGGEVDQDELEAELAEFEEEMADEVLMPVASETTAAITAMPSVPKGKVKPKVTEEEKEAEEVESEFAELAAMMA